MSAQKILSIALVVTLVMGLTSPAPARADVVHLRTGEAVKGHPIQERSNEKQLVMEDYLTGALRRFAWAAVDTADADRIQELWGWKNTAKSTVLGDVLIIRLDDRSTVEERGVIERETEQQVFLRRAGEVRAIEKARIASRDQEQIDVRDVWTAEQLMDQFYEQLRADGLDVDNPDSRTSWRIAQYAEWVEALEVAKQHYEACTTDEEFLKKDIATERLQRVLAQLQDAAARETLKNARMKLGMNLFRKVREILDGFGELHPEASEAVLEKAQSLRSEFTARRTTRLQQEARRQFVDIVENLIEDKVREEDVKINDVTGWTRRELVDRAFERLAEKMDQYDDVTPEEARTFWDGRDKRQWKKVSYGSGTFIVERVKVKPPKQRRRPSGGSGGSGGGAAPAFQPPKPPTRDQWWDQAKRSEREKWTLAYFVENSELFELGNRDLRPCPVCLGQGVISKVLQTGDVYAFLCYRCAGSRNDITVKFR